ncbi:peptidase inhibitor family I36 protein [Streptomyces sp. ML-6]|uniref:peptidase inhibitor family I36 protein n=1 Tax=Streptomyces sp. ML-6 TaxID=2982693 RepID=UPI0024BF3750|nr:peptidase inhibitor family I36 protein [Streptomyces sp. ML-6]MDK0521160.1 peptidase inhibitor family I36 protein [Streptomyces sp. ML-6]
MLRKSLTTAALAGALLAGVPAIPAVAADPNTCPKGNLCGWSGTNRTGTRTVYSKAPGCYPITTARSFSNQTSYRVVLWHISTGCGEGTKLLTLNPGTYTDNTGSTATGIEVYG